MTKTFLFGLAASAAAFIAMPANAADLTEQLDLCAAAASSEGLTGEGEYRVKFINIRGGSSKMLTVDLIPSEGGDAVTATCSIRRGEVTDVALKA